MFSSKDKKKAVYLAKLLCFQVNFFYFFLSIFVCFLFWNIQPLISSFFPPIHLSPYLFLLCSPLPPCLSKSSLPSLRLTFWVTFSQVPLSSLLWCSEQMQDFTRESYSSVSGSWNSAYMYTDSMFLPCKYRITVSLSFGDARVYTYTLFFLCVCSGNSQEQSGEYGHAHIYREQLSSITHQVRGNPAVILDKYASLHGMKKQQSD